MQAVNYPLDQNDALTCHEFGTDFGDDLFNLCDVPEQGFLQVVSQPTYGIVTFYGNGHTWHMERNGNAVPGPDSFTYRVGDGQGNFTEPATVRLEIAGL